MKRLRILFAPLGFFLSHLSRCLAAAEGLKKRGHEIAFMSVQKDEETIINNGYSFFPVYNIPREDIIAYGAPPEYQKRLLKSNFANIAAKEYAISRMVDDDLSVYSRFKPDVAVFDNRPTVAYTAYLKEITAVSINNLSLTISNSRAVSGDFPITEDNVTVEQQIIKELAAVLYTHIKKNPKDVLKSTPVVIPGLPQFENTGKLDLMGNPPHRFIGSLYWSGWDLLPKPDIDRYKNRTVILVTLGSTFPFQKVVEHVLAAFSGDRYHVIINTGNQFTFTGNNARSNYEILPLICLREFLKISQVVIHHGGHGTTTEVLKAGLPSVIIPFNGDQIDIARRIENFHCGIRILKYPEDVSAAEIRQAAEQILADASYCEQAQKFSSEYVQWPAGEAAAADFIEECYAQNVKKLSLRKVLLEMKGESAERAAGRVQA